MLLTHVANALECVSVSQLCFCLCYLCLLFISDCLKLSCVSVNAVWFHLEVLDVQTGIWDSKQTRREREREQRDRERTHKERGMKGGWKERRRDANPRQLVR